MADRSGWARTRGVIELAERVCAGERRALARAITLVESTRADHREQAVALLEALGAAPADGFRLGISGVPGVGKSTFIEAFGRAAIEHGHRPAILTVDPTSDLSGGSILGDKTRMSTLARDRRAFIRPSPAGGTLGGVARRTRETIALCEAAGFDAVMVETVGVGQSETAVSRMTDMFVLLLLPGGGDELQGIKRGILELADLVLVNKADGELADEAARTAAEYRNGVRLLRSRTPGWTVPVEVCSAVVPSGIDEAWMLTRDYLAHVRERGVLAERRAGQARDWMWSEISAGLEAALAASPGAAAMLRELEPEVTGGRLAPAVAAARVVAGFLGKE